MDIAPAWGWESKAGMVEHSFFMDETKNCFDAPKAGKYKLTANVVTPKPKQRLFASANGGAAVEIALPYTIGMWDKTEPVEIRRHSKGGANGLSVA